MIKKNLSNYNPDWAAPPGNTIKDKLVYFGMSQVELAKRMGMAKENVNEILSGKSHITPETSLKLQDVLDISADFILKLENNYRIHLARIKQIKNIEEEKEIFHKFPIKDLIEKGWVIKKDNIVDQINKFRKYLGIASLKDYNKIYAFYRMSNVAANNAFSIISWLRKGEMEAVNISSEEFNKELLLKKVKEFRKYTNNGFNEIKNILVEELKECGVALIYLPCIRKVPIYGAVKWINPKKALLIMSLRYKTNDVFWFTFMHEIHHLLYPKKKEIVIDDKYRYDRKDEYEQKADNFAKRYFISSRDYNRIISETITRNKINEYANELGIAPGIIVGRLQHDEHIKHNQFNDMKIKYENIGDGT